MAFIGFPITILVGRILDKFKVKYVLVRIFLGEVIFNVLLLMANHLLLHYLWCHLGH